ncbi:MAG: hypothetical protein C7B46_00485 [Sulfobacillus benefaciens]|uniref:Right handed beta helix domain-containing protein n=1 Tax=Sulfobacillus benefaciens TaxID=453960 RepID=A0A2T2XLZ2_9FIRM|nr:MAG: hypothetical protein C7B46_00485 [Sulfobacillus benefaciens]
MNIAFLKRSAWLGLASTGVLVALSAFPGVAALAAAAPTTIYVSTQGNNTTGNGTMQAPYQTIQYAINQSADGSTVIVEPGNYNESLMIQKSITLESASSLNSALGPTTISGANQSGLNTIWIDGNGANGTVIDGFTITAGSDHGIFVENANQVTIENNLVTGNGTAGSKGVPEDKPIELVGTANALVKDNTVTKNLADGGIGLTDNGPLDPGALQGATLVGGPVAPSKDNVVEDNTVTDNQGGCGIVLASYNAGEGVVDNHVVGNTVSRNVAGVVVATDAPNTVAEGNVVSNNTVENSFIAGIILHSNAPGDVLTQNVVSNNSVSGNGFDPEVGAFKPTGIVEAGAVDPVTDSTIIDNHVTNEFFGIFVNGSLQDHIANNIMDTTVPIAPALELVGPTMPVEVGQSPTFTAEDPANPTGVEYQFWMDSASGWKMVQNYSSSNSFTVKDIPAGSYQIVAYAMTPTQLKAQAWKQAIMASQFTNVGSTVSLTTMSLMNGMPVMGAMVQAMASHLLDPVYQFWWEGPNGHWTSSGNYSPSSMITIPSYAVSLDHAGTYHVIVYAKDANAPETAANEVWSRVLTVQVAPTVDFLLTPSLSAINVGGSATLTLAQVYTNGQPASGMSLDNLNSTFTITGADGKPALGFTISGFGVSQQVMTDGTYTFKDTPTAQSGSVVITAGSTVTPGIYQVIASDPDHMDSTSLPVDIVVNP